MEINPVDIVYHLINIGVLYALLRLLLYKPVSRFMQARTARIDAQLQKAAALEQDAQAKQASYEALLKSAGAKAEEQLLQTNREANEQAAQILSKAQAEAAQILREAREKAQEERRAAVSALEGRIAETAVSLAGQILRREVKEQDNLEVIEAFFRQAV